MGNDGDAAEGRIFDEREVLGADGSGGLIEAALPIGGRWGLTPKAGGGNFDIMWAMSSFIQSLTPTLFWDVDRETIDAEKHRRFVLERVLERGGMRDWRFALAHYGLEKIVGEAQQMRSLSPKTLAFVACVGGVEKESFRCYSLQPLHRKHWVY